MESTKYAGNVDAAACCIKYNHVGNTITFVVEQTLGGLRRSDPELDALRA